MKRAAFFLFLCGVATFLSCEKIDLMVHDDAGGASSSDVGKEGPVSLEDVAVLLSSAALEPEQLMEVHDAVSQSVFNGYDEEYTMKNIFECPGAGVGDSKDGPTKVGKSYEKPLREVFERYYASGGASRTRGGSSDGAASRAAASPASCLDYIKSSPMQIYWPYSDSWDGRTAPVVTFAPSSDAASNVGWCIDGNGSVSEVVVTEEMARKRPVWVINNNDDASFTSLEMIRRDNPEWSQGGSLVIGTKSVPQSACATATASPTAMPGGDMAGCKTLIMKEFTMLRNYDSWFAGASEFFVKIASIDAFTASTEAEMYLYDPRITDFMVVVKRNQVGKPQNLNTVLVSEWTSQLQSCAFMIIEDDGGTWTSWDCSAVVKVESKSYGFEVKIPYRSRDDVVWRGTLGRKYIEATKDLSGYFGDVRIVFDIADL